jgi:hypothetical protein
MPNWVRHALRVAVVVTFAFGLGPRLVLLQLVAWSKMTSVNLEVMPLDQALKKAMSGRNICVICRIIQQTQNHQNGVPDEAVLADILSPLIPLSPIDVRVLDVSCESSHCVIDPCSIFIIEQLPPPSPPPRLVV